MNLLYIIYMSDEKFWVFNSHPFSGFFSGFCICLDVGIRGAGSKSFWEMNDFLLFLKVLPSRCAILSPSLLSYKVNLFSARTFFLLLLLLRFLCLAGIINQPSRSSPAKRFNSWQETYAAIVWHGHPSYYKQIRFLSSLYSFSSTLNTS